MKKLDIIFQIDGKEVTEKEMEKHFIQNIDELIKKVKDKNLPLFTIDPFFDWPFLPPCIIISMLMFGVWFCSDSHKPWLLVTSIVIMFLSLLLISAELVKRRRDIIKFKIEIEDVEGSDCIYHKICHLERALSLISDSDEMRVPELSNYDFKPVQDFDDVRDITKANFLDCSYIKDHLKITYAEEDGRVSTMKLYPDEMYESTSVTNDTLICSDKSLICQKAYYKN